MEMSFILNKILNRKEICYGYKESNDKNKASTKTAQDAVTAAEKSRKDYIEKLRAERAARANK